MSRPWARFLTPRMRAVGSTLSTGLSAPAYLVSLCWSPSRTARFSRARHGAGVFLVLSPRPPGESALFEPSEVKPFAPDLHPGDRLAFVLRANATRNLTDAQAKKHHHDVVVEALRSVPPGARAVHRLELRQQAGQAWLSGHGARAGFRVLQAGGSADSVVEPPGKGRRRPRFGVIDLEGLIKITDPAPLSPAFAGPRAPTLALPTLAVSAAPGPSALGSCSSGGRETPFTSAVHRIIPKAAKAQDRKCPNLPRPAQGRVSHTSPRSTRSVPKTRRRCAVTQSDLGKRDAGFAPAAQSQQGKADLASAHARPCCRRRRKRDRVQSATPTTIPLTHARHDRS